MRNRNLAPFCFAAILVACGQKQPGLEPDSRASDAAKTGSSTDMYVHNDGNVSIDVVHHTDLRASDAANKSDQNQQPTTDGSVTVADLHLAADKGTADHTVTPPPPPPPITNKVRLCAQQTGDSDGENPTFNACVSQLEEAGKLGCDIFVMKEQDGTVIGDAPIPGIYTNGYGAVAKQYKMYAVGWQGQQNVHPNCQVIVDRSGKLVPGEPAGALNGIYHKVHMFTQTEAVYWPVFNTDFGKVGFQTCMDMHYLEGTRGLRLNGAKVVLGGSYNWAWEEGLYESELALRVNALLNGVYYVFSTMCSAPPFDMHAMVINDRGEIVSDHSVAQCKSQVVAADVDLADRYITPGEIGTKAPGVLGDIIMAKRRPSTYKALTTPNVAGTSSKAGTKTVAAIQWGKDETLSATDLNQKLILIEKYLDQAGNAGADVVVLPEGWSGWTATALSGGTILTRIQAKALAHQMFVVGWQVEQGSGGKKYNTTFLVGRDGGLVGSYHKVHLDWQDEAAGITAGTTYPAFDTTLEKVGFVTGFENLIFEASRMHYANNVHMTFSPISTLGKLGRQRFELALAGQALLDGMYKIAALNSNSQTDAVSVIVNTSGRVVARGNGKDGPVIAQINTGSVKQVYGETYREWIRGMRRPETYGTLAQ